jgi:type IV pilus assembly protein PilN
VILINLLPHREEKRRRRQQAFYAGLVLSAIVGLAVAGTWWVLLQQMTSAQQDRNAFLTGEIRKLEAQIKDIANLRAEIEALKARQKAVEDLQTNRNVPVYLLNEIAKQTPEGVYLTAIRQSGAVVTITGVAQTNERVSEFLRNTQYNSPWLERPELVEIKIAGAQSPNAREAARAQQRRLYDFSLRVSLKQVQPPADAPAAAPARMAQKP